MITTLTESEDRVRGIEAGADDFLSKPSVIAELEARVRSLTRLKLYTDELDSAESFILSLGLTIEARDPCTKGHCQRLAAYAMALGERLVGGRAFTVRSVAAVAWRETESERARCLFYGSVSAESPPACPRRRLTSPPEAREVRSIGGPGGPA